LSGPGNPLFDDFAAKVGVDLAFSALAMASDNAVSSIPCFLAKRWNHLDLKIRTQCA
jgi:hypothetical protein